METLPVFHVNFSWSMSHGVETLPLNTKIWKMSRLSHCVRLRFMFQVCISSNTLMSFSVKMIRTFPKGGSNHSTVDQYVGGEVSYNFADAGEIPTRSKDSHIQ